MTAVVSALLGGAADPFSNLANILTTPVRGAITAVVNWTEEKYSDAFEQEQLKQENEELKQRVSELEQKERDYEAALQENERLRNVLELRPRSAALMSWSPPRSPPGRPPTGLHPHPEQGLRPGGGGGRHRGGRILEPGGRGGRGGENWCTVRTLIDSDTEMGGLITRTGGAAILEGDLALMGEGKLKLTFLPENSQLMSGDLVTTSGRGGVYPSGIAAGHVEEVRTDASGIGQYAVIVPETDLDNLKQVFIIKDFTIVE